MNRIEATRHYCEHQLRECECDNLYFGKDKGSIYWVEGAEAWVICAVIKQNGDKLMNFYMKLTKVSCSTITTTTKNILTSI